jgi:uncharacterized membrane protein YkvA (DUF1232 family)
MFRSFCEALPVDQLPSLRRELETAVKAMLHEGGARIQQNTPTIQALKERSELLLARYEQFGETERKLAIGAIRYFLNPDDPFPEEAFASGFDDDVRVMNHVLEAVGCIDQVI